jgi:hypothetical protein
MIAGLVLMVAASTLQTFDAVLFKGREIPIPTLDPDVAETKKDAFHTVSIA